MPKKRSDIRESFGIIKHHGPPIAIERMNPMTPDEDNDLFGAIRVGDFNRTLQIIDRNFKQAAAEAARRTRIHNRAREVLGSNELAREWTRTPAIGLNQMRPRDMADTEENTQIVLDFLDRIHTCAFH